MKRKIYWQLLPTLCLLAIFIGYAQNTDPLININKISIQPDPLSTKIILETNSLLPVSNTYYAQELPQAVVIDFDNVQTVEVPQVPLKDPQLVEEVRVDKPGANQVRLFLYLKERVPYRIFSHPDRTVIELNKIQRTEGEYIVNQEAQQELKSRAKTDIFQKINISEKSDQINITTNLSNKAICNIFALENPLRLVVDLLKTRYVDPTSVYPLEKFGVGKVRVAQFQSAGPYPITRLVFDLAQPKYYALNAEKNELVVSFFKDQPAPKISAPPPLKAEPAILEQPAQQPEKPEEKKVEKPEVQAQPAPEVPTAPPKTEPAQAQETKPAPNQVQEDKFKPKVITGPEEKYTGEIVSLKFKDADLRDVILFLGELANLNVVFDAEVRGTVTCSLEDVPWDQALDILLRINKMGKTLEGNVLRIAPIGSLTREAEEQRKLTESKEQAGPVQVKTVTLSYSKAKDVQALLRTKISPRGEIIIDERTNTLVISDVKEKLDLLERLLSVFDTPTPQVSIEARIVEATSNFIRNLGIQWGFLGNVDPFYGNQTALQFPNKIQLNGALIPQGITTKGIGGPLGGYAINLPAPAFSTAIGFSFANVLDTFRLDVALSALETTGEGRIISCPKVTTQNNQAAEIIQGRQIPVQTVANFTVTTRYVNAALELRATPQITAEGTIIMTIEIQNNAADFANLVNGIPPITTQSARTTVMVGDGGTTAIGGIYRTEDSITRERVPFLHRIPFLGNLFRSFSRTKQNRELLIFITPRIIK